MLISWLGVSILVLVALCTIHDHSYAVRCVKRYCIVQNSFGIARLYLSLVCTLARLYLSLVCTLARLYLSLVCTLARLYLSLVCTLAWLYLSLAVP